MARPRIEIDQTQFEKLCGLQCTLDEIAGWFGCSEDTIELFCKRTYGERFTDVYAKKRCFGKISLRRAQWKLAEKNAAMAIFLGKNYLGQSDTTVVEYGAKTLEDDALTRSLKEFAKELNAIADQ